MTCEDFKLIIELVHNAYPTAGEYTGRCPEAPAETPTCDTCCEYRCNGRAYPRDNYNCPDYWTD